jgi:hypothetical protein
MLRISEAEKNLLLSKQVVQEDMSFTELNFNGSFTKVKIAQKNHSQSSYQSRKIKTIRSEYFCCC